MLVLPNMRVYVLRTGFFGSDDQPWCSFPLRTCLHADLFDGRRPRSSADPWRLSGIGVLRAGSSVADAEMFEDAGALVPLL